MMKNEYIQSEAVQFTAAEILKTPHVSVAESVQIILQYVSDNRDKWMTAATVEYMEAVLELVCQACEPEQVVL